MGQWQCKASAVAPSEASCRLLHHKKPRAEFFFRKSHHLDRSLSVSWQRMRCRPQRTNRALSSWQTVPLQSPQIQKTSSHLSSIDIFKNTFESMMFSKIHDEEACRESKTAPTVQFSFQERWRAVCLESVREPLLWFGLICDYLALIIVMAVEDSTLSVSLHSTGGLDWHQEEKLSVDFFLRVLASLNSLPSGGQTIHSLHSDPLLLHLCCAATQTI